MAKKLLSEKNPKLTKKEKQKLTKKIAEEAPELLAACKNCKVLSPGQTRELINQIAQFISDLYPNRRELMTWQTLWSIAEKMPGELYQQLKSY